MELICCGLLSLALLASLASKAILSARIGSCMRNKMVKNSLRFAASYPTSNLHFLSTFHHPDQHSRSLCLDQKQSLNKEVTEPELPLVVKYYIGNGKS